MTTIAWDGKTIAADTLMCGEYIEPGEYQKLHRTKAGEVVGAAGSVAQINAFLEWFKNGGEDADYPQGLDCFQALVISPDDPPGQGRFYEARPQWVRIYAPNAAGSGASFAMGAMLSGANAKKAVQVAIKLDTGSGGSVRTKKI